ncbi:hypothetical protein HAX54_047612 [Datura stramonium]|uniref:Uncharacterized protein n=1 Tax=Datura stramonium TaxID=4076 RepID=A0ABS8WM98_DATST|nr:hypothetical protein [Datura stramonium]
MSSKQQLLLLALPATVQVSILLDDGTSNVLMKSVGGGVNQLLDCMEGITWCGPAQTSRRVSAAAATAISTIQSMPLSGCGWISHIVICSLRPQFRYLGETVAIPLCHWGSLCEGSCFVATPTTVSMHPLFLHFCHYLRQSKVDGDIKCTQGDGSSLKANEVAVGGGGVASKIRPVGPLVIVGVRDGVLWLIDRYMCAHAISIAILSNDLKRALQCLLTMSNSRDIGQETLGLDLNDLMNMTKKKENVVEAVQGVVKFVKEFMELIDAADATAQADIAREALKRLAAAGSIKGAL